MEKGTWGNTGGTEKGGGPAGLWRGRTQQELLADPGRGQRSEMTLYKSLWQELWAHGFQSRKSLWDSSLAKQGEEKAKDGEGSL